MYDESNTEIYKLADNELKSDEPLLIERCPDSDNSQTDSVAPPSIMGIETTSSQPVGRKKRKPRSSNKPSQVKPKDRWYQKYSVAETYATYDEISLPSGDSTSFEVSAFQAMCEEMGAQDVDVRPHIYDKKSNQFLFPKSIQYLHPVGHN